MLFFVSPLYFHWHALHHAYPSVPYSRLGELKTALRENGVTYPHHDRPTYLRALIDVDREVQATREAS